MASQTRNEDRPHRDGAIVGAVPAQANVHIYQGALVEIDGNGRVKPAAAGGDKAYFGIALDECDNNPGTAGQRSVDVRRRGAVRMQKSGTAVVGKRAYVVDDQTVTDDDAGRSAAGIIIDADDDGVWVELGGVLLEEAYG